MQKTAPPGGALKDPAAGLAQPVHKANRAASTDKPRCQEASRHVVISRIQIAIDAAVLRPPHPRGPLGPRAAETIRAARSPRRGAVLVGR
eukprot:CAMPEP_0198503146 /NCGR_PEP_ID=MMETSP1462-20131121/9730_1 /TAXON_ID=1333877 /ORGANISM="Brandtodinium nutriculum, Strain RCC3387" /LENGTH=89 /DNA_ID=CAMNT_0044232253 /DNA_START=32 /DNA_END=298 /DNA_ORIENTATION=+